MFPAALAAALISLLFLSAPKLDRQQPNLSAPANHGERWYIIKIAEAPAGYLHEISQRRPEGLSSNREETWRTDSELHLVLNRMGSRVEIRFSSSTEESVDGWLRRTSYEMQASSQAIKSEAFVGEGAIVLKSEAGGQAYTSRLPYKGQLLGPEGIRRFSAAGLKKPGDRVILQTFVAEASAVSHLIRTMLGTERLTISGGELETLKIEESLEGMPVKRTLWLDKEGYPIKQEEPGPFGTMTVWSADQAVALAAVSGAGLPREMSASSIVRTNIRLPRAYPIERLRLRLIHKNPDLGWPDFSAPNQMTLDQSDSELVLEIRRLRPPAGLGFPAAISAENREYLAPNAYIQSDDPEIREWAANLIKGEKDLFSAALTLRRWVTEEMSLDLGIVFAPSSEILRHRRGTCLGYATLLAALARAAGIPSRVVMGYVYAMGMFGGHAWTEVLAGKEWIPLDAAIVNEGTADAARFYLIATSLADGPGELSFGAGQQVFGQIEIRILEYEAFGKKVIVPEGAKAFSIEESVYENPWLEMSFRIPQDASLSRLDAVWPDPTLARLDWPDGTSATLIQAEFFPWQDPEAAVRKTLTSRLPQAEIVKFKTAKGEEGFLAEKLKGDHSAAAFRRGQEIFIWEAKGEKAAEKLKIVGASFSLRSGE